MDHDIKIKRNKWHLPTHASKHRLRGKYYGSEQSMPFCTDNFHISDHNKRNLDGRVSFNAFQCRLVRCCGELVGSTSTVPGDCIMIFSQGNAGGAGNAGGRYCQRTVQAAVADAAAPTQRSETCKQPSIALCFHPTI